jgi:hypothetical protein
MIRYQLDLDCTKCDAEMQVSGDVFDDMERWTVQWRVMHSHHPSMDSSKRSRTTPSATEWHLGMAKEQDADELDAEQ